jgi:ligand-binding SRPBCC domain-containing protein
MIKKVKKIFGIRIWESPYSLNTFLEKLKNNDVDIKDPFEVWIHSDNKPKSFKHIKKYLDKEGFTSLAEIHFTDIANKMAILC